MLTKILNNNTQFGATHKESVGLIQRRVNEKLNINHCVKKLRQPGWWLVVVVMAVAAVAIKEKGEEGEGKAFTGWRSGVKF